MRDCRKGLLALTLLASLALCGPAAASASTRSASLTLGNAQEGTVIAKCPKHQRATGGGFLGPAIGGPQAFFTDSRKVGQRSWLVSAFTSGSPVTITGYVYCAKDAPKTTQKASTGAVSSTTIPGGGADAKCSSGKKAQAGGFSLSHPSSGSYAIVFDSFRVGSKTWRSRAQHNTGTPTVTSYVYCADQAAPKTRSGSVVTSTNGTQPSTARSADCKRGTKVVAGGISQADASAGGWYLNGPWESFKVGKGWQTSGLHVAFNPTTLTAIAYCA
jgi:hypothetical protein